MIYLLAGAKRTALQVGWSQGRISGVGAENEFEHNSLNFGARSPKFCMVVANIVITCSIFKLEAQEIAWSLKYRLVRALEMGGSWV